MRTSLENLQITTKRETYEQFKVGDTAYYLTPTRYTIRKTTIKEIIETKCRFSDTVFKIEFKLANGEMKEYKDLFDSKEAALSKIIEIYRCYLANNQTALQKLKKTIANQKRKLSQLEAIQKKIYR